MTAPVTIHGPWTLGTNLTATGNVVDASGGGGGTLTGVGTPGYVAVWSSPTNLATSTIYDSGTQVTLTKGIVLTPNGTGTAGVGITLAAYVGGGEYGGGNLLLRAGPGLTNGYGGGVSVIAGYGTGAGNGGNAQLVGGSSGVSGAPGAAAVAGGNAAGGNTNGGPVGIIAGAGYGSGSGGTTTIGGGVAGLTGVGGTVILVSGNGGVTSGNAGPITINSGSASASSGGNGGNIDITLGTGDGAGHRGRLNVTGLPTSNAGLASGDVWLNSNVLTIVP
jgi:hypothetical protein